MLSGSLICNVNKTRKCYFAKEVPNISVRVSICCISKQWILSVACYPQRWLVTISIILYNLPSTVIRNRLARRFRIDGWRSRALLILLTPVLMTGRRWNEVALQPPSAIASDAIGGVRILFAPEDNQTDTVKSYCDIRSLCLQVAIRTTGPDTMLHLLLGVWMLPFGFRDVQL